VEKVYSVYILANQRSTVLYTGVTGDLRARLQQHREKLLPGFTDRYNVSKLVYYEVGGDASGHRAGEADKGRVAPQEDRTDQSTQSRAARSICGPVMQIEIASSLRSSQ
jgi:predicted GIY-YIG superfamily endonuclease